MLHIAFCILGIRMDKKKIKLLNTGTTQKKPTSRSNVSNISLTPNNNTPKNVNHRSKSNLTTLKDSDAVRRLKSKYNTAKININFKYLV